MSAKVAKLVVPAAWVGTHNATAAALMVEEGRTLKRLRADVQRSHERVLAMLAVLPPGDRRRAAERAIAGLRAELTQLASGLTMGIMDTRLAAKTTSLDRLAVEWDRVRAGIAAAKAGPDPGLIGAAPEVTPTDSAAAESSASSFSSAWLTASAGLVWRWAENDNANAVQVYADSVKLLDGRIRRIAATETARAFADARDEGMGWVAERYEGERWYPALFKVWNAENDRKRCPVCADLHGTIRPFGIPFPDGQEPGYVHPFCRCTPTTIFIPIRVRGEYVPGRRVDDDNPREAA